VSINKWPFLPSSVFVVTVLKAVSVRPVPDVTLLWIGGVNLDSNIKGRIEQFDEVVQDLGRGPPNNDIIMRI